MIKTIQTFILAQKARIFAALIGLAAIGAMCVLSYWKGTADGALTCEKNKVAAITQGEKTHAKIEQKVMAMPDSDLDKRLSRWLRE